MHGRYIGALCTHALSLKLGSRRQEIRTEAEAADLLITQQQSIPTTTAHTTDLSLASRAMDHHVMALDIDDDETAQQQTVRDRGRRIKAAAKLVLVRSSRGRHWGRALGRRAVVLRKDSAGEEAKQRKLEGEAEEEKVTLLRQLVPGGEEMAVERLLEETADYITALRAQVGVMRALACLLSGSGLDALPEKEGSSVTAEKPL